MFLGANNQIHMQGPACTGLFSFFLGGVYSNVATILNNKDVFSVAPDVRNRGLSAPKNKNKNKPRLAYYA